MQESLSVGNDSWPAGLLFGSMIHSFSSARRRVVNIQLTRNQRPRVENGFT